MHCNPPHALFSSEKDEMLQFPHNGLMVPVGLSRFWNATKHGLCEKFQTKDTAFVLGIYSNEHWLFCVTAPKRTSSRKGCLCKTPCLVEKWAEKPTNLHGGDLMRTCFSLSYSAMDLMCVTPVDLLTDVCFALTLSNRITFRRVYQYKKNLFIFQVFLHVCMNDNGVRERRVMWTVCLAFLFYMSLNISMTADLKDGHIWVTLYEVCTLKTLYMIDVENKMLLSMYALSALSVSWLEYAHTQQLACLHVYYQVSGYWKKLAGVRFLGTRRGKANIVQNSFEFWNNEHQMSL